MKKVKLAIALLRETHTHWQKDKAARLAAALAYYTVISLLPIMIVAIAMAGLLFSHDVAQAELIRRSVLLLGPENTGIVQKLVQNAQDPASGTVAALCSLFTLLFAASSMFTQLKESLNTIWQVNPHHKQGVITLIRNRLTAFVIVLSIGFLLLLSLLLRTFVLAVGLHTETDSGVLDHHMGLASHSHFFLSFGLMTLLFAIVFKVLPDCRIRWSDVWLGAALTALLFTLSKFLIGFYLSYSSLRSLYGAAGSFVVLLLWIYYSAQILFLGAEFTKVYARRCGSHLRLQ